MRIKLILILGALFVALAVIPASAAEIILYQCEADTNSSYSASSGFSQRFTPDYNSTITAMAVPLGDDVGESCTGPPCNVFFYITSVNGSGQPISPALWASGPIPATDFPDEGVDYDHTDYLTWLKYPVTPNLSVTGGVSYGIVRSKVGGTVNELYFGTDAVAFGFSCYGQAGHFYSGLADADTWTTSSWVEATGANSYPYVIWGEGAPVVLQATGVESGEHELRVEYDGANTYLYLDDVLQDSDSGPLDIAQNSSNWEMFTGNAMPYVEYVEMYLDTVLTLWYQFDELPGLLLEDRSAESHDVIARYPDTPPGVGVFVLPLTGGDDVTVGTTGSDVAGDYTGGVPVVSGLTPGGGNCATPTLTGIFDAPTYVIYHLAQAGNMPCSAVFVIIAFIVTALIGLIAYAAFRKGFIMYIAMLIGSMFAIFYGDGIWGWIVPITFAAICAPFLVKEMRT